ncbi:MAG: hypothetical protein QXN15_09770 [Candidatus Jordarchaeales archaeon]
MKSTLFFLKKRIAPYVTAAITSSLLIAVLYVIVKYAFTPSFIPLQLGNHLYLVNTNILTVKEYAVKASIFVAVTLAMIIVATKLSRRLTSEITKLVMPPLAYLEYWRENKRASAALLTLAYLSLLFHAAAAAMIWFNALQEHLLTLYSILLSSAAASITFSAALLLLPQLDEITRLTDTCKKLVEEVSETPAKEDYKKIELLTLLLHAMVTDAVLRNIKQVGELNPQPYLATLTLAMIHGEKSNVQKAKQAATKLLDHLAGGEYHLLLQALTEIEKQLPEIPKMAEKMELTLNEPAQFIYAPRTRKNIMTRALLPVAATSAILVTVSLLKWLFYFTMS